MKFTDGFWQVRPGVEALYARETYDIDAGPGTLTITAPTKVIASRGDTLNRPVLTVTLSCPAEGVIGVRVQHHRTRPARGFDLVGAVPAAVSGGKSWVGDDGRGVLDAGCVRAVVSPGAPFRLEFLDASGRVLTASGEKSVGYMKVDDDAQVAPAIVGTRRDSTYAGVCPAYLLQQLDLGVGETVYGLGERFGAFVKNGQSVDIWNADGGTASEQAYKNVPFYLTNRGYGVLVNNRGAVSFEVGSEAVERVQFSVPGEDLEYFIIAGPTPKDVLRRYTALTGRPARIPAWSYGLWLSTSFTTDYDEETVTHFIDSMAERDLPLSVFHFDCFWMREFNWCDFEWDSRVFPDPKGMLSRLHDKDLRVCVWINPYIGQRSALFDEAAQRGFLVRRSDGEVWQWDMWQAGMGLVDFTNPDARAWFQGKLRRLIAEGVDCFKTDFGERIPLDVEWADGDDPQAMHNWYSFLYNEAVHEVLTEERGAGQAVLFSRSATAGGQRLPVHWGGDSTSTYESMAESLRGGLSLALSGFGFWSHDIGGFEGTPDAGVFKRWAAFGLLSSHSRFHGSDSYRVPWLFDDEAVAVVRTFAQLKNSLMPYLYRWGLEASAEGIPLLRPMILEFPDDPAVRHLDTQYMLGPDLLVAPVFTADGSVEFYLPQGEWTNWFTGAKVEGGRWLREQHGFLTLPLYVRQGAVLPVGACTDRPDYDYLDGLALRVYPGADGEIRVPVTTPEGKEAQFTLECAEDGVRLAGVVFASGGDEVGEADVLTLHAHSQPSIDDLRAGHRDSLGN